MADIEAEAVAKQQAAIRRETEEQERRNTAARKAEEEERRRAVEGTKQQKTALRVRGRVTSRGVSASANQSGYMVPDSSANTSMASTGRGGAASRRAAVSQYGRVRGSRGRG